MATKKRSRTQGGSTAGLNYKPANKQARQLLHIKRKRAEDEAQRTERFARRKEEAKNPKLKAERLKRNIPLTIERKRVWDEVDGDIGDGLGLSVDIERLKRKKQDEDETEKQRLESEQLDQDDGNVDEEDDEDEIDSMIMGDSEDETLDVDDTNHKRDYRRKTGNDPPSATERATSPSMATRSTNIDFVPDALAAKFPSLFSSNLPPPKILITTSINSTLHREAKIFTGLFPNSVYIRRTAHKYAHKFSIRDIAKFATNRNFTHVIILTEDQKHLNGMMIVKLSPNDPSVPPGPTFSFSISSFVEGKKLPGHGNSTGHWPELILNNFRTPLALLTAQLLRSLFPPQPDFEGRQVVTFVALRDFIFARRHRYMFRTKREGERSVVGADGKEMGGVEGVRTSIQPLGPSFTMKLRRIDKGVQRVSGQEWEWKGGMEKNRTKFQL
jgi:ribosome production factor 1